MSNKDTSNKKDIDSYSGVETTGHEWDGIKELNNPLPKWWLWTTYATIAFSVVYWVLMPSWPLVSTYTKGFLGYSQRAVVAEQLAQGNVARAELGNRLLSTDIQQVEKDQGLLEFAFSAGKTAFADNCAGCHGSGAEGSKGYPNLNDDDWLWGGDLQAIEDTIKYGIRSNHDETRVSEMPAFGRDELLEKVDFELLVSYLGHLSGNSNLEENALGQAETLFADNCASCHGKDANGDREQGAPNLVDAIWLYGSDSESLRETLHNGRSGNMPAWEGRLDPTIIRALAVYVHTRGGGE